MKIALVYPPFADATQPYSSLPVLAGYIRSRGHHEIALYDANLDFVLYFLSQERIESAASRIRERICELERGSEGRSDRCVGCEPLALEVGEQRVHGRRPGTSQAAHRVTDPHRPVGVAALKPLLGHENMLARPRNRILMSAAGGDGPPSPVARVEFCRLLR